MQLAEDGATQAHRPFQHHVEYRPEVAGRGVDDLQYLGSRSLPLQRLVTLASAVGKFSLTLGKLTLQIGDELLRIG